MNVSNEYPLMVFKNENGSYSIGLSDKEQNGNYVNWYKNCSFKRDVVLENKTSIYIKKAWLKCNEVNGKKYEYVFISEFEIADESNNKNVVESNVEEKTNEENGIIISDSDLPF